MYIHGRVLGIVPRSELDYVDRGDRHIIPPISNQEWCELGNTHLTLSELRLETCSFELIVSMQCIYSAFAFR